ncbi:MAG: hypothetical protein R2942_14845 [Ignavibacteria bacterium]
MGSLVSGLKSSSFTSGKSGQKDIISQLNGIKGTVSAICISSR